MRWSGQWSRALVVSGAASVPVRSSSHFRRGVIGSLGRGNRRALGSRSVGQVVGFVLSAVVFDLHGLPSPRCWATLRNFSVVRTLDDVLDCRVSRLIRCSWGGLELLQVELAELSEVRTEKW